jgi:biotin carboxylase
MAIQARGAGVNVPDFVALMEHEAIAAFMERVPPPWIIKPRSDVSAIGIRKIHDSAEVWRIIEEFNRRESLRERASYYVLAQFVAGEVFHVDSIVNHGQVAFAGANAYGRPPMEVAHHGGAYVSQVLEHGSEDEKELLGLSEKLVKASRLQFGATHAEFIKSAADGRFYFLEIAARVGGAYIAEVLEAASGVNLWREWARIEVENANSFNHKPVDRRAPLLRNEYAGIILSLARQEWPDTSTYDDPEIVYRVKKKHHVGLIVRSEKPERVTELIEGYGQRFADDFAATLPPLEKAE